MRAALLVRRNWRATVFLVLLAGLAGGIAIGAWSVGRRTAAAFDRFVDRSNVPDLILTFCPPEMTSVDSETVVKCYSYDPVDELAAMVGALGISSLAHAVVLSARRHRRQLAVLRTLGFSRGQAAAAVRWQATVLGLAAAAVGVPVGVVAARWGWLAVAEQLGVASGRVVPLVLIAVVMLAAVLLAHVVAVIPAWRAARMRPAEAFRVE